MKNCGLGCLSALLLLGLAGCGKSGPGEGATGSQSAIARTPPLSTIHWLGMKRLAADTNAAAFMHIWNLPETANLRVQTLDRLALAPWRMLGFLPGATNAYPISSNYLANAILVPNTNPPPPAPVPRPPVTNSPSTALAHRPPATNAPPGDPMAAQGEPPVTNRPPIAIYQSLVTNPPASLLRPLLDDVVQEESYLEVRQPTNQPGELAFAIKLDDQRASLWQTNFSAVLASLTGVQPTPSSNGWSAEFQRPSPKVQSQATNHPARATYHVSFTRAGQWTILGLAQAAIAGPTNPVSQPPALVPQLPALFTSRIQSEPGGTPCPPSANYYLKGNSPSRSISAVTNSPQPVWLETDLDLHRVAAALACGWDLPAGLPRISLAVRGDGRNVLTRAGIDFPSPLPLELEPWNIPTNLIHDPVIGFMAVRGFRPWLKSFKPWNDLGLGTPPNQAVFWARKGLSNMHFLAAPSLEASNQVSRLSAFCLSNVNPLLDVNKMGKFALHPDSHHLGWRGFPLLAPDLDYVEIGGTPFIVAGLVPPNAGTNRPAPLELLQQVYSSPNLVLYDWEFTGFCVNGLTQMSQVARYMFCRARLSHTASFDWLLAVAPRLGNAVTGVNALGPTRLSLSRSSTIGLTGAELEVLADWLESPDFPSGLHTFRAPIPPSMFQAQRSAPASPPPAGK